MYWARTYRDRITDYQSIDEFDGPFRLISSKVEEKSREERRTKTRTPETKVLAAGEGKKGKQKRDWGDKVSKEALNDLDLSSDKGVSSECLTPTPSSVVGDGKDYSELMEWDFEEEPKEAEPKTGIWRYFDNITGQKEITRTDLQTAQAHMKEHLTQKNVAAEVAEMICSSVADSLIGKKTGTFRTVAQMVRDATETAVSRILMPKAGADLLEDIKRTTRPYVMAFIGVNGVGKSTNLSKVCFWLLQNKLRILIVAGDTFRSGAVEQLRTHVRNLSVGRDPAQLQLYERGYGKDAAAISKEAIAYAKTEGFDVVMIDTAGRMQGNAPLMAALAKLVYTNRPHKLIFVGEALVGNEAVDQLKKFNGALCDYASGEVARIDGILLTKFDTIDDKVGAAISMTYIANAPILFVGVGQTYTDLRKMNVRSVVASLLK
ncbi:SRP54-domain-containing protein [Paramicrosporidium saccamoebae]|uniref:SRP54-domain-containing protein n=1 Tax=Paramicrosporidium saccamoebae TaxID=1246581 RepID=A0A2H9TI05_9FUNG|nr:SRP54-domain-containing protein [Paramicrosporidium saccamoebae]